MYNGKNENKRLKTISGRKKSKARFTRFNMTLLSLVLLFTVAVGGTIAYLTAQDGPIENTFTPSEVKCEVTESFNGEVKSNVNVKNTGDTEAYIRVRLVTYRVNDDGQRIGGTATIPNFDLGENWVKYGDCYYYTLPVKAGESPETCLIGEAGVKLVSYDDVDGGKQVIEVMAEAIQSGPDRAVAAAWGVKISAGSVVKAN